MIKVLEFFEKEMVERFLNLNRENTHVIGFSSAANPQCLLGNSTDEFVFHLIVEMKKEFKNDVVVSVAGSPIPRTSVGHYMSMEE